MKDVSLRRWWWDMQRFGFSPAKLATRLRSTEKPKIFCNSIPKSGTHLLERCLCLHPQLYRRFVPTLVKRNVMHYGGLPTLLTQIKGGQILVAHLAFSSDWPSALNQNQVRSIFMIRDLRDVAISLAHHISQRSDHRMFPIASALPTFADKLRLAIEGSTEHGMPSMKEVADNMAGWLTSSGMTVRFEDLIGPQGGGDETRQLATLRQLFAYLDLPISDAALISLRNRVFSNQSPTFRKGATRQWTAHFDPDMKQLFKSVAGESLILYQYEKDYDW